MVPDWRLLAWEAVGRPTGSGAFYMLKYECIFDFLWLVQSWKQGQNLEKLPVSYQLLAIWDQLL